MIQLTALPMPGMIDVPRLPGVATTMTSDFALALATLALPEAVAPALPVADVQLAIEPGVPERQDPAGIGTPLPPSPAKPVRITFDRTRTAVTAERMLPLADAEASPVAAPDAEVPPLAKRSRRGAAELAVPEAVPPALQPLLPPATATLTAPPLERTPVAGVTAVPTDVSQAPAPATVGQLEPEPIAAERTDVAKRRADARVIDAAPLGALPLTEARAPSMAPFPDPLEASLQRVSSEIDPAPAPTAEVVDVLQRLPGSTTQTRDPVRLPRIATAPAVPAVTLTTLATASAPAPAPAPAPAATPSGALPAATGFDARSVTVQTVVAGAFEPVVEAVTEGALPQTIKAPLPDPRPAGPDPVAAEAPSRSLSGPAATAPVPAAMERPQPPVAQPASTVFAAAMFFAERTFARPPARTGDIADLSLLSGLTTQPAPVAVVHAPANAQPPVLDTRQHDWPAAMIERIEVLRDAVETNVRETRIRLVPDALGPVDVSIRQDGDVTSVRLTADTAQARAMLAEAAPRLTELAEARGLKLAQAGVESGHGGFAGRPGQQQQPEQLARPAPAAGEEATSDDDSDSYRIA